MALEKIDIILDMETGDPDDYLTLCLLSSHPNCNLRAVTINPGTLEQVGLVRKTLSHFPQLHKQIPVGSRNPNHNKKCVSAFHYKIFGEIPAERPDDLGFEVIYQTLQKFPNATILTGAPVTNLKNLLDKYHDTIAIKRWVAQGGFAGDNVVEPEFRMKKFDGMVTCSTYNFGGDIDAAEKALNTDKIQERLLVSKNVCHSVGYDKEFHLKLAPYKDNHIGLRMIFDCMDVYLDNKGSKNLHDPLAACVAIEPSICKFKPVTVYHEPGNKWGSKLCDQSNTFISVAVNKDAFFGVFSR